MKSTDIILFLLKLRFDFCNFSAGLATGTPITDQRQQEEKLVDYIKSLIHLSFILIFDDFGKLLFLKNQFK